MRVEVTTEQFINNEIEHLNLGGVESPDLIQRFHQVAVSFVEHVVQSMVIPKFDETFKTERDTPVPAQQVARTIGSNDMIVDILFDIRGNERKAINWKLDVAADGGCQFTTFELGKRLNEAFEFSLKMLQEGKIPSEEEIPETIRDLSGTSRARKIGGLDLRNKAIKWLRDFDAMAPIGLSRGETIDLMLAESAQSVSKEEAAAAASGSKKSGLVDLARRFKYLCSMAQNGIWGDSLTAMAMSDILGNRVLVHRYSGIHPPKGSPTELPPQPAFNIVEKFNEEAAPDSKMTSTIRACWGGTITQGRESAHYDIIFPSWMFWTIRAVLGWNALRDAHMLFSDYGQFSSSS